MNTEQLKYFVTVAQLSHMSKAAELLNISQPSLSSNIQRLEREIGVDFFDRVGRSIVLNSYGKVFLNTAKNILSEIATGEEEIKKLKRRAENRINVRIPSLSYYPDLQEQIYGAYPDLTVINSDCKFADLLGKMLAGDFDFCIVGKKLSESDLAYTVLGEVRMAVLVPESSVYAKYLKTDMSVFQDAQFADLPSDLSSGASELVDVCKMAGYMPDVAFVSNRMDDLIDAVRYGNKIAWVPLHVLDNFNLSRIHVINIEEPGCFSHLIMYWNQSVIEMRPLAASVRSMTEDFFKSRGLDSQ